LGRTNRKSGREEEENWEDKKKQKIGKGRRNRESEKGINKSWRELNRNQGGKKSFEGIIQFCNEKNFSRYRARAFLFLLDFR
jgi:hypothetical protein